MDREIPGKWRSKRLKLRNHPQESSQRIELIGLQEGEREETVGPCNFTSDALSNFLVLKNIFRHLDGEDLECCKLVNRRWNFILAQIYTRHYEVSIEDIRYNPDTDVTIQKLEWSSKQSDTKKFSFPDAVEFLLEESSKERKFSINLGTDDLKCIENPAVEDFVSKVGYLVSEFEFTTGSTWVYLDPLCRLSIHYFPNLSYLNLSHTNIDFFFGGTTSWEDFIEYLKKHTLCHLRKICFGKSLENNFKIAEGVKLVEALIKMAPNLKEIHEFPVQLVDALIFTGKTNLVKSVCCPDYVLIGEHFTNDNADNEADRGEIENDGPLEISLKKLAGLEPKLISFSFSVISSDWIGQDPPFTGQYPNEYMYHEDLKLAINQILQSSHQSLKTLRLHPLKSFDFGEISPFTSLTRIQFIYIDELDDFDLFPSNTNYDRIFPNVTTVEIVRIDSDKPRSCDPSRSLSPWGSKITELILNYNCYPFGTHSVKSLAETFPSLKRIEFLDRGSAELDTLSWIFPLIADLWPGMEVITFDPASLSTNYRELQGFSFDSIFTGIPKKSLDQLKRSGGRKKFTKKKMESFYAKSTIRKLSNLQKLEFHSVYLYNKGDGNFLDKLYTISSLSKEFGFDFLPSSFKIIVRSTSSSPSFEDKKDMKKVQQDLSSVVKLEFETYQKDMKDIFFKT